MGVLSSLLRYKGNENLAKVKSRQKELFCKYHCHQTLHRLPPGEMSWVSHVNENNTYYHLLPMFTVLFSFSVTHLPGTNFKFFEFAA